MHISSCTSYGASCTVIFTNFAWIFYLFSLLKVVKWPWTWEHRPPSEFFLPETHWSWNMCVRYWTKSSAYIYRTELSTRIKTRQDKTRQDKSTAWITFVSMTRHKLPSINFSNFSNSSMFSPCRSSPLVRLSSVDHHMYQHCKLECDLLRQRVIDPEILPQFTGFLCYFLVQHGMHSTIKLKGQKRILPLLIHDHGILWNL